MAGVLLHLAMGDPRKLNHKSADYSPSFRKAYAIGLLLPDIAKQGFIDSAQKFNRVFDGCAPEEIPTYEEYLQFSKTHHFNPDLENPSQQDTRSPNLQAFLSAEFADLEKPVWQGAFCHLMGDRAFYYKSYCVDDARAMEDFAKEVGPLKSWDCAKWRNSKTGTVFYHDYDVLNQNVEDEYGVLEQVRHALSAPLLEELLRFFHVSFSSDRPEPVYMNLKYIKSYIVRSRQLNQMIDDKLKIPEILRFFDDPNLEDFFGAV